MADAGPRQVLRTPSPGDGLHRALVWSLGTAIGALMLFATAGAVAKTGADLAGRAATTAAATATASPTMPDTMMRPAARPAATTTPGGATAPAATRWSHPQQKPGPRSAVSCHGRGCKHNDGNHPQLSRHGRCSAHRSSASRSERRVNETIAEATRAAREAADRRGMRPSAGLRDRRKLARSRSPPHGGPRKKASPIAIP